MSLPIRRRSLALVAAVGITSVAAGGLTQAATSAEDQPSVTVAAIEAVAQPKDDLKLAFTVDGKVSTLAVQPGDHVHAGQVLAELEDKQGRAMIDLYTLRSQNDADIRASQAKLALAKLTEAKLKYLVDKDAASPFEYKKAIIQSHIATINVDQAKEQQAEARQQLAEAQARHAQYLLKAPIDGVIDSVKIEKGETVKALQPVIHLVSTKTLRVDVPVPTEQTLSLHVGEQAAVHSELRELSDPIRGEIIAIAPVADAASGTRIVRLQLTNYAYWPAGIRVKVSFPSTVASAVGPHDSP